MTFSLSARQACITYLKGFRLVTLMELSRAVNLDPSKVHKILKEMILLGQARQVQRGIYEWVARGTYEAMDSHPVSCQAHS